MQETVSICSACHLEHDEKQGKWPSLSPTLRISEDGKGKGKKELVLRLSMFTSITSKPEHIAGHYMQ